MEFIAGSSTPVRLVSTERSEGRLFRLALKSANLKPAQLAMLMRHAVYRWWSRSPQSLFVRSSQDFEPGPVPPAFLAALCEAFLRDCCLALSFATSTFIPRTSVGIQTCKPFEWTRSSGCFCLWLERSVSNGTNTSLRHYGSEISVTFRHSSRD